MVLKLLIELAEITARAVGAREIGYISLRKKEPIQEKYNGGNSDDEK